MQRAIQSALAALLLIGLAQAAGGGEGPSDILKKMPVNSDQRCVGIAAVAEALFDAETVTSTEAVSAHSLAKRIFLGLSRDQTVSFPESIYVNGLATAIEHPTALRALTGEVANLYKEEAKIAWATEQGSRRLHAARAAAVRTKSELLDILDADVDRTVLFCCFGSRRFPTGEYRETYHAVLLSNRNGAGVTVFDPNDPGTANACQLTENIGGLTVEWSCRYRDSGMVTDQFYAVVHGTKFFQIARGLRPID